MIQTQHQESGGHMEQEVANNGLYKEKEIMNQLTRNSYTVIANKMMELPKVQIHEVRLL